MKEPLECSHCGRYLDDREIEMGWHFGNKWFCGNSCATGFTVDEIIKLKRRFNHEKSRSKS